MSMYGRYVSLNKGVDYHATGQSFVFYTQPTMVRTGCLGAVKGCLTTGPTTGNNPVKVTGSGFSVFVDYSSARCRFLYGGTRPAIRTAPATPQQSRAVPRLSPAFQPRLPGGVYYNRIATLVDGDFLGTGLNNGSITADGASLYCITPQVTTPPHPTLTYQLSPI
jgi:hypothetical protein